MSAGAVSAMITFLLKKVEEETSLQYAVPDKITELIRELSRTGACLEDAEKRQRGERSIRQWIYDVRDISYSLEDELVKYSLVVEKRKHQNWVFRYACIFKFLEKRHQIGTNIDHLQKRIEGISRSRSAYGIENNLRETSRRNEPENENFRLWRGLSAGKEEFSFVGLQNDLKILKDRLLDAKEPRCCISVVGMGGLGKTTIARKVYKDVRMHFDRSAWVNISQEFKMKDVLEKIRRDITRPEKEKDEIIKNEEELGSEINELLKGKKYLVVLDDVWKNGLWLNLKRVFPEENNGSRLLLTTRNEEVAKFIDDKTPPHNLSFLDKDESWELFRQKVILEPREDPEVLFDLGKEITQKCGGLPLAIVVLGGLLSRHGKQIDFWKRVSESISPELKNSPEQCKDILAMSYDDLPFNVKPCFLYFGLFPEDTDIPAKRLIEFWVAENLIQAQRKVKLEDAAERCLEELITRSLVQVAKREPDGGVKKCRIHDLLRDLAIEEAEKDNFVHTPVTGSTEYSVNIRRLSIQSEVLQERKFFNLFTNRLRSLFLMSSIYMDKVEKLIPKMQLLRVLNMPNFPLKEFPKQINQLIHLRYLGLVCKRYLYDQGCCKLLNPVTLSNLKHLQTLNYSGSFVEMSHSIWTLRQLRHVYGGKFLIIVGDAGDQRIDGLEDLQTLHLPTGDWINSVLENLSNLKDLRIDGWLSEYQEGISKALKKLLDLRVLELSTNCDKIPQLPSLSHLRYLRKMVLEGPMESLPRIDEFPPNLVELKIKYSTFKQENDPFGTLQNLKWLKSLKLDGVIYKGNEINILSGGFPKLEVLKLEPIETWNVEEGAFSRLKRLVISFSDTRSDLIPEALKSMESLRELELHGFSNELLDRVKIGGEDWHKVKHVPSISISIYGGKKYQIKT